MPDAFLVARKACWVVVAFWLASLQAAEPVSPLIGVTRDQLLVRYGEPKNQMVLGDRLIYLYAREKIVLRNDVVVEVEPIAAEVPRRAPAETPAPTQPPAPPPAAPGPAAPGVPPTDASAGRPGPAPGPATVPGPAPGPAPGPIAPPPSEPKIEFKLVRPPGSKDLPPAPRTDPTPNRPAPETSAPSTPGRPVAPVSESTSPVEVNLPPPDAPPSTSPQTEAQAKAFAAAAERERKAARRRLDEAVAQESDPSSISGSTILIAVVVLVGGIGLLVWRFRQRELELAATSVANTPLSAVPPPDAAPAQPKIDPSIFTAEMLGRLDWKRFEELVAAYYSKTGVVAARTLAGPDAAVHVKISWKGEPRPFAYVQCVMPAVGVVEPKALQSLLDVLSAEDIRRGHVVTTGKFSPAAIKLAEEKKITLLAGDVFLEKLNALPSAARLEIVKAMGGAA